MLRPVLIGFILGFALVGVSKIASAADDGRRLTAVGQDVSGQDVSGPDVIGSVAAIHLVAAKMPVSAALHPLPAA